MVGTPFHLSWVGKGTPPPLPLSLVWNGNPSLLKMTGSAHGIFFEGEQNTFFTETDSKTLPESVFQLNL